MGLILKRFWPHIVGALLLLAVYAWHKSEVSDAVLKERTRIETEQAEVIAKRMLENAEREQAMALETVRLQTELEGKLNATEIIADNLRNQLRTRRVCTDEIRPSALPPTPATAGERDGATQDAGPTETVGDRLIAIGHACQDQTDQLIAAQGVLRAIYEHKEPVRQ